MSRKRDLIIAFGVAVCVHCIAGVCTDRLLSERCRFALPVFPKGESSVDLTLMPVYINAVEYSPLEENEKVNVTEMPETQDEVYDHKAQDQDADMDEKGVISDLYSDSVTRPRYPLGSRLRGEEGVVSVAVRFGSMGALENVEIVRSSGFSALDRAAEKAMRAWAENQREEVLTQAGEVIRSFRFILTN